MEHAFLADDPVRAVAWGAEGVYGHAERISPAAGLLKLATAHDGEELAAAGRAGADGVFLSPVFATRSHPGAPALGRVRFGRMIRGAAIPVIALGGMDARRARSLAGFGVHGWAAIDAWTR